MAEASVSLSAVALAWSIVVAFVALLALVIAPDFYLDLYSWLSDGWVQDWTSRAVLSRTPPRWCSTRSTVASLRPARRAISRIRYGCFTRTQ